MSVEQSGAAAPNLVERAKAILLTPKTEWEKIAVEPADTGKLITGYLLPLAVLAAVSFAIGASVFGIGAFGFTAKLSMTTVIAIAVTQIVMAVVGALVFAWVINALAPSFGSTPNMMQAQKLVVYSYTANFLAAVFQIYPPLSALSILGLYSLVLLYMGLTPMMKTPQDKRVGYFVVAIICAIVVFFAVGVVTSAVRTAISPMGVGGPGGFSMNAPGGGVEGKIATPGGGTLDLSELEKAAKQMEAAQKNGGAAALVAPAQLQALLPGALPGGFARTAISSESAGAAGMGASTANATYTRGGAKIELTVVHMGGMAAMASMAGAMGVTANREDANGYEKANSVDGRLLTEAVDRGANTAKFAVVGKNGAAVTAEGSGGVTVDEAKAAVAAVSVERVEALGGGAK
jgi:hypothetical protein